MNLWISFDFPFASFCIIYEFFIIYSYISIIHDYLTYCSIIMMFQHVSPFENIANPMGRPSAARSARHPQRPAAWARPSSWRTSGAAVPRSLGPSHLWKVLALQRKGWPPENRLENRRWCGLEPWKNHG